MAPAATPWRCQGCETWNEQTATACVVCDKPAPSPNLRATPQAPAPASTTSDPRAETQTVDDQPSSLNPHVPMHNVAPTTPAAVPPSVAALVANVADRNRPQPAATPALVVVAIVIAAIAVAVLIGVVVVT